MRQYYVIEVRYSNGLESEFITQAWNNEKSAAKYFVTRVAEIKRENSDMVIEKDYLMEFVASSNDAKGNGFHLIAIDETSMMDKIIVAVEKSNRTTVVTSFGDDGVEVNKVEPVIIFDDCLPFVRNSVTSHLFQPQSIYRRESNDETIYDVVMRMISNEAFQSNNFADTLNFCDSLECVGVEVLANIYYHLGMVK